ncbi:M15 family metallopeptidase [Colwellia sp. MEBiC06753]
MSKATISAPSSAQVLGIHADHVQAVENGHFLHLKVIPQWHAMKAHALQDGLNLELASSYRSFKRQLAIWNKKFSGELPIYNLDEQVVDIANLTEIEIVQAIMLFSALPGASRHHWGTDIDVYAPNLLQADEKLQLQVWEYQENGPMAPLNQWLNQYAKDYGFYRPYDKYRGGISEEPWHLSSGKIAANFQQVLTEPLLAKHLAHIDIAGKKAILEYLPELFEQFILNIREFSHG